MWCCQAYGKYFNDICSRTTYWKRIKFLTNTCVDHFLPWTEAYNWQNNPFVVGALETDNRLKITYYDRIWRIFRFPGNLDAVIVVQIVFRGIRCCTTAIKRCLDESMRAVHIRGFAGRILECHGVDVNYRCDFLQVNNGYHRVTWAYDSYTLK